MSRSHSTGEILFISWMYSIECWVSSEGYSLDTFRETFRFLWKWSMEKYLSVYRWTLRGLRSGAQWESARFNGWVCGAEPWLSLTREVLAEERQSSHVNVGVHTRQSPCAQNTSEWGWRWGTPAASSRQFCSCPIEDDATIVHKCCNNSKSWKEETKEKSIRSRNWSHSSVQEIRPVSAPIACPPPIMNVILIWIITFSVHLVDAFVVWTLGSLQFSYHWSNNVKGITSQTLLLKEQILFSSMVWNVGQSSAWWRSLVNAHTQFTSEEDNYHDSKICCLLRVSPIAVKVLNP